MFHLIPYQPEHYLEALGPQADPYAARLYFERGPAWTGFLDDTLLGCGGVAILHPGVGEAWMVFTTAGRQHPTWMIRAVARGLLHAIRTKGLVRVQADVVAADLKAHRFCTKLGFAPESLMPLYGPGREDFIRLAMFPAQPAPAPLPEGLYEKDGAIWAEGYEHPVMAGATGIEEAILIAGIVATVAGTAVSAYSAIQAGESRAQAARYNRKVALNQAQEAKDRAAVEVQRQRQHAMQVESANRAQMGASGAVGDYGSALLVAQENALQGEMNAQVAEYTGEVEAANYMRRAQLMGMEGQQAQTAGYLTAGSTTLSGMGGLLREYGKPAKGEGFQGGYSNLAY
jgi:hypothetical protein